MNDVPLLPFLRYYPTQPASSGGTLVRVAQRGKPLIEQLDRDFLQNVPFESESDKPRFRIMRAHRPADKPRPTFALAVRKVAMTRRKLFTLRSPAWRNDLPHARVIGYVEADVPLVEREAPPVAIDSPQLFGQTPLDGVRAQRYIGKSAQGSSFLGCSE